MSAYFFKYSEWIRVEATKLARLNKDYDSIIKTIDLGQFENIFKKHKTDVDPPEQLKFFDIEKYLKINLRRAYVLGLHRAKPMNILDLGSGVGYFAYVCKHFGHNAQGLDMDVIPIFNDVIDFLKIDRTIWKINPFEKLPDSDRKFDLITAFAMVFNRPRDPWNADEWEFFLKDLSNNLLAENGQAFFQMPTRKDGKPYDKDLLDLFLRYGAKVYGSKVYFQPLKKSSE